MTPGKFLRLIWPSTGHYCIAHPFKIPGTTDVVYAHKVFPDISAAVTHCLEQKGVQDVYFAVLTLREAQVWKPDKDNRKTGEKGAFAVRTQDNMLAARALFFDLDVGPETHKYPTQGDALRALLAFMTTAKLPLPTLISSGGGVHVYWHLGSDLPVEEWITLATNLRHLAEALKLKVDPTRTTDVTSVLRVPDTSNWKDRSSPRPVKTLQVGSITPVEALAKLISDALIRAGVEVLEGPVMRHAAPGPNPFGESNLETRDFGPPPTLQEVAASCLQVQEIIRSQMIQNHPHFGQLDNTAWYRGMLGTIKHVENGDQWCRNLTAMHPRTNADIEAKLLQLERFPPARCETLQEFMPWKDAPCATCRFRHDPSVPNPIAAARKTVVAPPPIVERIVPGIGLQAAMIPNPPKPYERLKAGGIAITRTDKDGNSSTSIIYAHDLYPIRRHVNEEEGTEQQTWRIHLPRKSAKEFTIDADVLYDSKKFCAAIAHNGIYPTKGDIPSLQDYMVAYISKLQQDTDADSQTNHLGWADEHRQFVLPDKTLLEDGTVKLSSLTTAASRAAQFIYKRGELAQQIALMSFYNHPDYLPNQSVILDALASVIFYATGHHGIVVNCSGDTGASKSTTLYTAAGIWGDPALWPINGTNRGATPNARAQRIATNANLPTCVDEITHLPAKEAIDLVMNITQPGHRLRLMTDGTERKMTDSYKSAIMIATANSSLQSLLSTDSAAGTAGSMRVFEMKFAVPRVHTKAQADEFLRQIRMHFGHIGEVFTSFVIRNRVGVERRVHDVMREIDAAAHISSGERFWSARTACIIVAGEIARALGLLPYDVGLIRHWSVAVQIPYMRGVIKEEYRDPLGVLTDYIAEKNGNIIVVERGASMGMGTDTYSLSSLHGALLGHYDKGAGVLYLLKQGFKDHCNRVGASSTRIIDELNQPRANGSRIVVERAIRRTLGAGTNLAKGQSWVFAVDMRHPDIAGVILHAVPAAPANDQTKVA